MVYEAYVGLTEDEIIKGLMAGLYNRYGGVIRVAKGNPDAGQIVSILQDVPEKSNSIVQQVQKLNMVQMQNFKAIKTSLNVSNQLLGLTSVGALSSVVNLGVCAAGFYIMNKKLNELQSAMHQFQNIMENKLDGITHGLQNLQFQLVELKIIALENKELLRYILEGLFDIQSSLYYKDVGSVLVALQGLDRIQSTENTNERQKYIDDLSRVRITIQNELDAKTLSLTDHSHRLLSIMMSYRLWAISGSGEIHAKRRQGDMERSAELSYELAGKSREWSGRWSKELILSNEYAGIGRYGYSKLRKQTTEDQRRRLARLFNNGDEVPSETIGALETKGANLVAQKFPVLGKDWIQQQSGIANILDMLEESTERLESTADITKFCLSKRLNYDRWEQLLLK
ncbi:hypothetical protein QUF90_21510 [Desulfococcaceae bacterium HSG9]|nr:hypothetical protein [Desulfococcaceae bacterium HSG9]